jgi:hypothetical protein
MATSGMVSQGIRIERDGGSGFNLIPEAFEFDGFDGEAAEIDFTHFQSTAKDFKLGLPDEGNITFSINYIPGDAEHQGLLADQAAGTQRNYKLILTDGATTEWQFAAFVKLFSLSGAIDDKIPGSVGLRITGAKTIV